VVVVRLFTPMRWAAVVILAAALLMGFWPELHGLLVFKDEPASGEVLVPVESSAVALPSTEAPASAIDNLSGNMVVTPVQSAAVAAQAAQAAQVANGQVSAASAPGAADGK